MLVISIIFGLCILSVMVYLALSKKSSFRIRVAAMIALGLMILAIIICVWIAISEVQVKVEPSSFIQDFQDEPPRSVENDWTFLILILFLLAIFVLVLVMSIREHRKHIKK